MKVRRIQAITNFEGFFDDGDIHIEYGDNPGFFYQEKWGPDLNAVGLPIEKFNGKGFKFFFKELDPIEFKETARYEQVKESIYSEIEDLDRQLSLIEERKSFLLSLI